MCKASWEKCIILLNLGCWGKYKWVECMTSHTFDGNEQCPGMLEQACLSLDCNRSIRSKACFASQFLTSVYILPVSGHFLQGPEVNMAWKGSDMNNTEEVIRRRRVV